MLLPLEVAGVVVNSVPEARGTGAEQVCNEACLSHACVGKIIFPKRLQGTSAWVP